MGLNRFLGCTCVVKVLSSLGRFHHFNHWLCLLLLHPQLLAGGAPVNMEEEPLYLLLLRRLVPYLLLHLLPHLPHLPHPLLPPAWPGHGEPHDAARAPDLPGQPEVPGEVR